MGSQDTVAAELEMSRAVSKRILTRPLPMERGMDGNGRMEGGRDERRREVSQK